VTCVCSAGSSSGTAISSWKPDVLFCTANTAQGRPLGSVASSGVGVPANTQAFT
jgi:hypothetical protein